MIEKSDQILTAKGYVMMSPGLSKNPEYKIETKRLNKRVQVFVDGEIIAETRDAIELFETGYDPVIYLPKNNIKNVDLLKFDDYVCPFKGHANLLTVKHGANRFENAAWIYDRPYDEFEELRDRVAFYPQKVQEIRITG